MTRVKGYPHCLWLMAGVALVTSVAEYSLAQSNDRLEYVINASDSEILWRVYKAGAFARFGHNHVISVRDPEGSIVLLSRERRFGSGVVRIVPGAGAPVDGT